MIWVAKNLYFFNCLLDGAHTKTVDGLFLFFPKFSQTFLYLEVEKATDQKFGSKSRLNTLKIE